LELAAHDGEKGIGENPQQEKGVGQQVRPHPGMYNWGLHIPIVIGREKTQKKRGRERER